MNIVHIYIYIYNALDVVKYSYTLSLCFCRVTSSLINTHSSTHKPTPCSFTLRDSHTFWFVYKLSFCGPPAVVEKDSTDWPLIGRVLLGRSTKRKIDLSDFYATAVKKLHSSDSFRNKTRRTRRSFKD